MRKANKFDKHYLGKKQKLLFLVATFVLGLSLFGCGKEQTQDAVKDEGTVQSVEGKSDSGEEETFSGDYTQPEKWGYTPYWLKYGLKDTEKKDLSTLTMFDCVTDGLSLNDILHSPEFTYYELYLSYSTTTESDNIDDIINYDDSVTFVRGDSAEIWMYKEKDGDYIIVTVYNLSDESKTLAQCIEGNQFYVGDNNQVRNDTSIRMAFGIELEIENHWNSLDNLCDLLGRPNQIYYSMNSCMNTDREDNIDDETFEETVEKGGGFIIYEMLYQLNHGKLIIGVSEHMYEDANSVNACYCTNEVYEYLRDETSSGALVNEDNIYNFE